MSTIIETLKSDGSAKGLCIDWQGKLTDKAGIKRLSELFIRGIDFCISENFPTLEFLWNNFKGKCEPYGIFIDNDNVTGKNQRNVVLNGKCYAELSYDGYTVSQVFIRHESKAEIVASGHSLITIDAFNDSHVKVMTLNQSASVIVNVYGNAIIRYIGCAPKIRRKNKETY